MLYLMIITPLLGLILLAINLILALHNPYKEKNSPFECGFHSFISQNRTQFNISFFIFGILFLLFDLEILLVYPYVVSAYVNGVYGLMFMLIFFIALTLGFAFELGKGALKLTSRQNDLNTKCLNNISNTKSIVLKSQMVYPASLLIFNNDLVQRINSSLFEAISLLLLVLFVIVNVIVIKKLIFSDKDFLFAVFNKMHIRYIIHDYLTLKKKEYKKGDDDDDEDKNLILRKLRIQGEENQPHVLADNTSDIKHIYSDKFQNQFCILTIKDKNWLHNHIPTFYPFAYYLKSGYIHTDKDGNRIIGSFLTNDTVTPVKSTEIFRGLVQVCGKIL